MRVARKPYFLANARKSFFFYFTVYWIDENTKKTGGTKAFFEQMHGIPFFLSRVNCCPPDISVLEYFPYNENVHSKTLPK